MNNRQCFTILDASSFKYCYEPVLPPPTLAQVRANLLVMSPGHHRSLHPSVNPSIHQSNVSSSFSGSDISHLDREDPDLSIGQTYHYLHHRKTARRMNQANHLNNEPDRQLDNSGLVLDISLPSSADKSIRQSNNSIDRSIRSSHNFLERSIRQSPNQSVNPSSSFPSYQSANSSNHQTEQPFRHSNNRPIHEVNDVSRYPLSVQSLDQSDVQPHHIFVTPVDGYDSDVQSIDHPGRRIIQSNDQSIPPEQPDPADYELALSLDHSLDPSIDDQADDQPGSLPDDFALQCSQPGDPSQSVNQVNQSINQSINQSNHSFDPLTNRSSDQPRLAAISPPPVTPSSSASSIPAEQNTARRESFGQSNYRSNYQSASSSRNTFISQSNNRAHNELNNQTINQSVRNKSDVSTSSPVNRLDNQSANRQSNNQSTNISANISTNQQIRHSHNRSILQITNPSNNHSGTPHALRSADQSISINHSNGPSTTYYSNQMDQPLHAHVDDQSRAAPSYPSVQLLDHFPAFPETPVNQSINQRFIHPKHRDHQAGNRNDPFFVPDSILASPVHLSVNQSNTHLQWRDRHNRDPPVNQSMCQSINQWSFVPSSIAPISQAFPQSQSPIKLSIDSLIDQPVNRSIQYPQIGTQSVNHLTVDHMHNQSINRSVNTSINQPTNQLINQSILVHDLSQQSFVSPPSVFHQSALHSANPLINQSNLSSEPRPVTQPQSALQNARPLNQSNEQLNNQSSYLLSNATTNRVIKQVSKQSVARSIDSVIGHPVRSPEPGGTEQTIAQPTNRSSPDKTVVNNNIEREQVVVRQHLDYSNTSVSCNEPHVDRHSMIEHELTVAQAPDTSFIDNQSLSGRRSVDLHSQDNVQLININASPGAASGGRDSVPPLSASLHEPIRDYRPQLPHAPQPSEYEEGSIMQPIDRPDNNQVTMIEQADESLDESAEGLPTNHSAKAEPHTPVNSSNNSSGSVSTRSSKRHRPSDEPAPRKPVVKKVKKQPKESDSKQSSSLKTLDDTKQPEKNKQRKDVKNQPKHQSNAPRERDLIVASQSRRAPPRLLASPVVNPSDIQPVNRPMQPVSHDMVFESCVFLLSSGRAHDDSWQQVIRPLIEAHGGTCEDKLVCQDDDDKELIVISNNSLRTSKFLFQLARGLLPVKPTFVQACIDAKQLMFAEHVHDPPRTTSQSQCSADQVTMSPFLESPMRSSMAARGYMTSLPRLDRVFHDDEQVSAICLFGNSSFLKQWRELVIAASGKLIDVTCKSARCSKRHHTLQLKQSNNQSTNRCIVIVVQPKSQLPKCLKGVISPQVKCVRIEWLIDTILMQSIQSFDLPIYSWRQSNSIQSS